MQSRSTNAFELSFIITGMKFDVEFEDDVFTDEEKKDLLSYIESMSREIAIDKTYVECNENKRASTFMIESGWNALRDTLIDSEYCRYLHPSGHSTIVDAFVTMARCYMYECVALKTENISSISIQARLEPFDVIVCKDTSNDWKKYPGKWQNWKFDENGKFCKR